MRDLADAYPGSAHILTFDLGGAGDGPTLQFAARPWFRVAPGLHLGAAVSGEPLASMAPSLLNWKRYAGNSSQ